jgi:thiol-disulfide isomerase/thioredoxin
MVESLVADRQTLYFFYSRGCGACEVADPLVDAFAKRHPSIIVLKLDASGGFPARLGLEIKATPTYMFRVGQDGRVKTGAMKVAEIEKWVKSIGGVL